MQQTKHKRTHQRDETITHKKNKKRVPFFPQIKKKRTNIEDKSIAAKGLSSYLQYVGVIREKCGDF